MDWLTLLYRLTLRPLRREPVRTLITALSIALGVAVVVAIELAGAASVSSFRTSIETVAGQADFEITAIGGVPEEVLAKLATAPLAMEAVARIEDHALTPEGETVPLIGLDLVAIAGKTEANALEKLSEVKDDQVVWLGEDLYAKHREQIQLTINDVPATYRVGGVVPKEAGTAAERTIIADIGLAQRIARKQGVVDRIEVYLPEGAGVDEWRPRIQALLPRTVQLTEAGTQTSENRRMVESFRWNVRILSYIALIVGSFLIYNTVAVSVVRRRNEIGVLRAIGASRTKVLSLFLGEAAVFGLIGASLGLLLGRVLAEGAVLLMGLTVEGLYVSGSAAPIQLTPWEVALSLAASLGFSLLAALAPALEAAGVQPVEAMARGRHAYNVRTRVWFYATLGLATLLLAGVLSQLPPPGRRPWWGYLAGLLLIGAASLLIPALITVFSRWTSSLATRWFGAEAMLAGRSMSASVWRSSVLVASVAVAVAMMVSVGLMVGSFRQSVTSWLEAQLVADYYLRPTGSAAADRHPTIDVRIADALEKMPAVAAVDRFRVYEIRYGGATASLAGGQTKVAKNFRRVAFLPGVDAETVMRGLLGRDAVIISEPFSNKHKVKVGDRIRLPLGDQERSFEVLGIYFDYSSERGYIVMDRATMLRYLPDPNPSNLAVYVKPGVPESEAKAQIEQAIAGHSVSLWQSGALRREAIQTFDRTFAITYAMEAVAIAVAVMGVAGSLLALVWDRRREMGLLRFLGASAGQIRKLVLFEAGMLGLLAHLAGTALGVVLGFLLIFVINKQSFGWSIQLHWPVQLLLLAIAGVYAATLLSAFYPARLAAKLNPIEVVHEE